MDGEVRDSAYRLARIARELRPARQHGPATVHRDLLHALEQEAHYLLARLEGQAARGGDPLPPFDPTRRCGRCREPVYHCRCDLSVA